MRIPQNVKLYYREKTVGILTVASLLCFVVECLWIVVKIGMREGSIPLHYTVLFGVDRLGPWYQSFYAPLAGLAILIVNFCLGYFIYPKDKYQTYFILLSVVIGNVFCIAYLISLTVNRL